MLSKAYKCQITKQKKIRPIQRSTRNQKIENKPDNSTNHALSQQRTEYVFFSQFYQPYTKPNKTLNS